MTGGMGGGVGMDRLVAERVMGWDSYPALTGMACARRSIINGIPVLEAHSTCGTIAFQPSTNIAHAWEVVEKLSKSYDVHAGIAWTNTAYNERIGECDVTYEGERIARGWADTVPLAICRAALEAVKRATDSGGWGGGRGPHA